MTLRRDVFGDGRIAHTSLRGQIASEEFTDGHLRRVITPVADLRCDPAAPRLDRQVLHGHKVRQLAEGPSPCRDETTLYVGYIDPACLGPWQTPTHRVAVARTLAFSKPDFKTPDPVALSCGSLVTLTDQNDQYGRALDGGWIPLDHLAPLETTQPDLADTAHALLGTPYLWGGNSAFGIDCSGLIQLACQAAGIPCPGDSDQQKDQLGALLAPETPPMRNDVMFWKGHVALVTDANTLIHANAHHLAVALEPIKTAMTRIEAQGDGPCLAHKRFAPSIV